MSETTDGVQIEGWKKIVKTYWKYLIFIAIGIVIAVIGAVFVGRWFVIEAQAGGLVPASLNQWTVGYVITFLLHLLFWEFIFIGIPVIAGFITIYIIAVKRLPEGEKHEQKSEPKDKRFRWGFIRNGVLYLALFIWVYTIYNDVMWNVEFQLWTFDYLAFTIINAIVAALVIVGIPAAIYGIIWLNDIIEE